MRIDPLIGVIKKRIDDREEVLDFMNDLKASETDIRITQTDHVIVKKYFSLAEMNINLKKSAIQLNIRIPHPNVSKTFQGLIRRLPNTDDSR